MASQPTARGTASARTDRGLGAKPLHHQPGGRVSGLYGPHPTKVELDEAAKQAADAGELFKGLPRRRIFGTIKAAFPPKRFQWTVVWDGEDRVDDNGGQGFSSGQLRKEAGKAAGLSLDDLAAVGVGEASRQSLLALNARVGTGAVGAGAATGTCATGSAGHRVFLDTAATGDVFGGLPEFQKYGVDGDSSDEDLDQGIDLGA